MKSVCLRGLHIYTVGSYDFVQFYWKTTYICEFKEIFMKEIYTKMLYLQFVIFLISLCISKMNGLNFK